MTPNSDYKQNSQTEQTPGFGWQEQIFEIEQCINGITELLLADNTKNLKESFHLINVSSFTNFLVDYDNIVNFSSSISNLDFEEIVKKKGLEKYQRRQNSPDSAFLLASLQKNRPGQSNFSQGHKYHPKIIIETEQPTRPHHSKYERIESQYSPKNLKHYLNKTKPQSPVNDKWLCYGKIQKQHSMQKAKPISPQNKSMNSSNDGSLLKQTQTKIKTQHTFCLIAKKHAQLTNSILKQQPSTDRTISKNLINSKYQKFVSN